MCYNLEPVKRKTKILLIINTTAYKSFVTSTFVTIKLGCYKNMLVTSIFLKLITQNGTVLRGNNVQYMYTENTVCT